MEGLSQLKGPFGKAGAAPEATDRSSEAAVRALRGGGGEVMGNGL